MTRGKRLFIVVVDRCRRVWHWVHPHYERFEKLTGTVKNVIVSGLGIIAFFYACWGSSHTSFHVAQATGEAVKLNVSTKAPKLKQSYVRELRMSFECMEIDPARLHLADDQDAKASVVISADQPAIIPFVVGVLTPMCRNVLVDGLPDRYTKKEVLDEMKNGFVTLTLSVQESNDVDGGHHGVTTRVPAEELQKFIRSRLPDDIPETTSCSESHES